MLNLTSKASAKLNNLYFYFSWSYFYSAGSLFCKILYKSFFSGLEKSKYEEKYCFI
ncbi:hypothetical protein HLPR_23300 [Helicovermis profundi]|uniref:Uncharacterized protein n=1 Tax=Helicovermis profundi TaxID=3065157 RepID=A0AAU9EPD7_9FIRM|nr:hypothetical protein HLPR_23300 [Clostridia bacterium S502]